MYKKRGHPKIVCLKLHPTFRLFLWVWWNVDSVFAANEILSSGGRGFTRAFYLNWISRRYKVDWLVLAISYSRDQRIWGQTKI